MAKITLEGDKDKFIIETDIRNIVVEQHKGIERHRSISGEILEVARGPDKLVITIKSPYTMREEIIKSAEQAGQSLKMKFIANDTKWLGKSAGKRWKEASLRPERIYMDEKNFQDILDWAKELEKEKNEIHKVV